MKFGIIKSKIEKCLTESFRKESFKTNMFIFKELVLENKNLCKMFYLYDELSTKKGLTESVANQLINESVSIYNNISKKISKDEMGELSLWLSEVRTRNNYKEIDEIFSKSVLTMERRAISKKIVLENLTSETINEDIIKESVPLKKLLRAANDTVNDFITTLNESDKKVLEKILNEDENKLKLKFEILKESVLEKLEKLKENESDSEVIGKINESLNKVENETFDRINYFKLQELNKNII
jgi:hypothetical protein